MPQAQIVASFTEGGFACLAVRVRESAGPPPVDVEYIGRVPMDDAWQALTPAQKKAALVAAAKAERDRSLESGPVDLGVTGSVTI